jgi:hypothetical protein
MENIKHPTPNIEHRMKSGKQMNQETHKIHEAFNAKKSEDRPGTLLEKSAAVV